MNLLKLSLIIIGIIFITLLVFISNPSNISRTSIPFSTEKTTNLEVKEKLAHAYYYMHLGDLGKVSFNIKISQWYLALAQSFFQQGDRVRALEMLEKSDFAFANAVLYVRGIEHQETQRQIGVLLNTASLSQIRILQDLSNHLENDIDRIDEIRLNQSIIVRNYAKNYQ